MNNFAKNSIGDESRRRRFSLALIIQVDGETAAVGLIPDNAYICEQIAASCD